VKTRENDREASAEQIPLEKKKRRKQAFVFGFEIQGFWRSEKDLTFECRGPGLSAKRIKENSNRGSW